jgi:hypothetical protein
MEEKKKEYMKPKSKKETKPFTMENDKISILNLCLLWHN